MPLPFKEESTSLEERKEAEITIVKLVQEEAFLQMNKELESKRDYKKDQT